VIDLLLSLSRHGSFVVVRVAGEIDLGTASQLSDYALAAIQDEGPAVVLDLSQVSFMDSTGLKVLIAVQRRAELAGGNLRLAAVPRPVMRVLTITGLDRTFAIYDTVEAATAGKG
jgi:anti-sigma B factor antagonist